mgnify:CR=1 FL=1
MQNGQFWRKNWKIFYPRQKEWGKVRVLLMTGEEKDSSSFYDSGNQAVTGVLIAAEGADNSVVSRNIVEGVMALFQLDAHKIKVMKMK